MELTMLININNLRQVYRSACTIEKEDNRENCPSPTKILKNLRLRHKKKNFLLHVTRCARCADEARFILGSFCIERQYLNEIDDNFRKAKSRF